MKRSAMKRVDVLTEIANGKMTTAQAYDLWNEIQDSKEAADLQRLLGFSDVEWRANCHGVPMKTLARWRTAGWPNSCYICKKTIEPELEVGWFATLFAHRYRLIHIQPCLWKVVRSKRSR